MRRASAAKPKLLGVYDTPGTVSNVSGIELPMMWRWKGMLSSEPSSIIRPHMPELDSVRGIAILLVLFLHGMERPLNATLSRTGALILAVCGYGGVGVNLFFVLSGFLITGILVDARSNSEYYRRFYLRRALRILPAFYFTLLLLTAGKWIGWRFLVLSSVFLANIATLVGVPMQYGPLWSLAVEEHFYAIWPVLVRRFSFRYRILVPALIFLGTPLVRAVSAMFASYPKYYSPQYTWCNLDGIALGALLAMWARQPSFKREQLSRLAVPMLTGGITAFVFLLNHPRLEAVFLNTACNTACAGFLSCVLLIGTSRCNFVVQSRVLRFFGFISYGLYLLHVIAFKVIEILFAHLFPVLISAGRPSAAMFLRFSAGSILGIGVAYLSRRSLEERFLRIGYASAHRSL